MHSASLLCLLALVSSGAGGLSAQTEPRVPGNSLFSSGNYIEYVPGDLPLVIAAPHGGRLQPADIPSRTSGVVDADANTQELARTVAAVIHAQTGRYAHLIICRLHRSRLDANRELNEAAQGNAAAIRAWQDYHRFIEQACGAAVKSHGVAFLIDLHGHGHPQPRVELGYLHSSLDLSDCVEQIDQTAFAETGSLALIAASSDLPYSQLLHGPLSLGALLEERGFLATPSPRLAIPDEPFFRGGYTVRRHCIASQHVTGLQMEANRSRLRDTPTNRLRFAQALVPSLEQFLQAHLHLALEGRQAVQTVVPISSSPPTTPSQ